MANHSIFRFKDENKYIFFTTINCRNGCAETHNPIYGIKDNWENELNLCFFHLINCSRLGDVLSFRVLVIDFLGKMWSSDAKPLFKTTPVQHKYHLIGYYSVWKPTFHVFIRSAIGVRTGSNFTYLPIWTYHDMFMGYVLAQMGQLYWSRTHSLTVSYFLFL